MCVCGGVCVCVCMCVCVCGVRIVWIMCGVVYVCVRACMHGCTEVEEYASINKARSARGYKTKTRMQTQAQ